MNRAVAILIIIKSLFIGELAYSQSNPISYRHFLYFGSGVQVHSPVTEPLNNEPFGFANRPIFGIGWRFMFSRDERKYNVVNYRRGFISFEFTLGSSVSQQKNLERPQIEDLEYWHTQAKDFSGQVNFGFGYKVNINNTYAIFPQIGYFKSWHNTTFCQQIKLLPEPEDSDCIRKNREYHGFYLSASFPFFMINRYYLSVDPGVYGYYYSPFLSYVYFKYDLIIHAGVKI